MHLCVLSHYAVSDYFVTPMDYSLTPMDYISVNGISHECVAISFSRAFPNPEIESGSPAWPGAFFTMEPLGKPINVQAGLTK